MAKYANTALLDGGLAYADGAALRLILLNNYTLGDSYATVVGQALCTVVVDSLDLTLSGADAAPRVLTLAPQTGTASANSVTPNLHVALTNGVDTVIWVTDETTDQAIVLGNTVNFPSITYTSNQPT